MYINPKVWYKYGVSSKIDLELKYDKMGKKIKINESQLKMLLEQSQQQRLDLPEVEFNDTMEEPNEVSKMVMKFIEDNIEGMTDQIKIQNSYDDAILNFGYWEMLPDDVLEKLESKFDVEKMNDYDEDTGDLFAYKLAPKSSSDEEELNEGIKKLKTDFKKFK